MFFRPISLVLAFVLSSLASAADLEFDGVVDDVRQKLLIGKPSAIQLMNGTVVRSAEVVNFIKDPRSDAIRFFQYKDGKRKPKIKTTGVYRLMIAGKLHAFRYHRPSNGLYLIDLEKAQSDAEARINDKDKTLREPQSEDEVKDAVADQIGIFNDGRKELAPTNLSFAESDFCLLLTDFPQYAAQQVAEQVDAMCEQMNIIFGLPKSANIWQGKMMVAVFSQRTRMPTRSRDQVWDDSIIVKGKCQCGFTTRRWSDTSVFGPKRRTDLVNNPKRRVDPRSARR